MPSSLIPTTIAECRELARELTLAGLFSQEEYDDAVLRIGKTGGLVHQALEANLFARIYAGAARGIDAAMAVRLFGIFGGTIRAVREGTLALIQGILEDRDERIILWADLLELEQVATYDPSNAEREAIRAKWANEADGEGKLVALERVVKARQMQLELLELDHGKGYMAGVCLVRRDGRWFASLYDLHHAAQQDLVSSEWWTKYPAQALKYAARQPLLHEVFADVLAGLGVVEDAPKTAAITAPVEAAADDEDSDEEALRAGVTPA